MKDKFAEQFTEQSRTKCRCGVVIKTGRFCGDRAKGFVAEVHEEPVCDEYLAGSYLGLNEGEKGGAKA